MRFKTFSSVLFLNFIFCLQIDALVTIVGKRNLSFRDDLKLFLTNTQVSPGTSLELILIGKVSEDEMSRTVDLGFTDTTVNFQVSMY